jgi:hypothetical protein
MKAVKATLTVILKANDVVVAEVEDPALWQRVLTVIHGGKTDGGVDLAGTKTPAPLPTPASDANLSGATGPLGLMAQQLTLDAALVQGACSPQADPPYMHLDPHCWEEMKRQLPSRGSTAVAPIVTATTLLALWFQKSGLGNPTQAQAKAVLATINVTDPNASRSIQNTSWLQSRAGGQVVLNPAEISKAVKLSKCFCSKDWSAWKETAGA